MAIKSSNPESKEEQNKLWIVSGHAYSRTGEGHYNLKPVLLRGTKKAFGKMVDDFIEWLEDNDLLAYPDDEATHPKSVRLDELEPEGIFSDKHQEAMTADGDTDITEATLRGYLAKTRPSSLFAQQTGTDNYIDIQMTEAAEE